MPKSSSKCQVDEVVIKLRNGSTTNLSGLKEEVDRVLPHPLEKGIMYTLSTPEKEYIPYVKEYLRSKFVKDGETLNIEENTRGKGKYSFCISFTLSDRTKKEK